jgi:hypothetical protein
MPTGFGFGRRCRDKRTAGSAGTAARVPGVRTLPGGATLLETAFRPCPFHLYLGGCSAIMGTGREGGSHNFRLAEASSVRPEFFEGESLMLNEQLKEYRKKVEAAISRALTDSPEINAAIEKIRDEGYEVFLIVEATVGFNRKEEGVSEPRRRSTDLELTSHDQRFLRALKISPE